MLLCLSIVELLVVRMKGRFPWAPPHSDTNERTLNDVRFAHRPRVFGLRADWGILLANAQTTKVVHWCIGQDRPGVEVRLVPLTEEVFDEMFATAELQREEDTGRSSFDWRQACAS
jgi:hypothetical protein